MDGLRFGDGYAVMFFFFREKWIGSLFKIKVYGQITSVEWSRLAKKYRRKNYTFSGGLREWRRVCVRWMVVLTGAGEKISAEEELRSGWCDVMFVLVVRVLRVCEQWEGLSFSICMLRRCRGVDAACRDAMNKWRWKERERRCRMRLVVEKAIRVKVREGVDRL